MSQLDFNKYLIPTFLNILEESQTYHIRDEYISTLHFLKLKNNGCGMEQLDFKIFEHPKKKKNRKSNLKLGLWNYDAFCDRHRRARMVVGFTTTYAISAFNTEDVCSNPAHSEVHSIQLYMRKFVNELWLVGYFLRVLRFPPPIKLTVTI